MNFPDLLTDLTNLEPEHFYSSTHKVLYYLLQKIYTTFKGEKIDPLTILSNAKNENIEFEKEIEDSGGIEYLNTLYELGDKYTKADILKQAEIVTKLSFFRDVYKSLEKQMAYIENGDNKSREELIDFVRQGTDKVVSQYTISDNYKYIGDVFDKVISDVKKDVKNGAVGIPTKIEPLNRFFTYRQGELVVLGARPKIWVII